MTLARGSGGVSLSGPPTTSKLRKYWGVEEEDPLESHDYIWNKDFVGRFKRLIQHGHEDSLVQKTAVKEKPSGFLSLNRVMTQDRGFGDQKKNSSSPKWRPAPTRREQEKWDRATKVATGGSEVMFRELRSHRGDPIILAAESREQYFKLWCLVPWLIDLHPHAWNGSSVDSLADGAKGPIKGAIGQPRLLVPVVLVMIYNRWNGILVPEYGALHFELVPMLIGFFTYKVATFAQAIEDALSGFS